jgi:hypothetical protein
MHSDGGDSCTKVLKSGLRENVGHEMLWHVEIAWSVVTTDVEVRHLTREYKMMYLALGAPSGSD